MLGAPSGDISALASESGGKEGRRRLLDQYLLRSLCAEPTADELHLSRASSLLAQLTDNNCRGSIQPAVYRDYVRLVCKSGGGEDVSRAISMLETACADRSLMESIGAGPWNRILDTLATNTSTREDIPRVVALFQTMRGLNVSVDEWTYQTMVSFMHRMGEFKEALGIWHSRPASVKATFETHRCVILSCLNVNESAAQVEQLLLDAISTPLGIRRTLSLLNEMISLGFLVLRKFFCAVL